MIDKSEKPISPTKTEDPTDAVPTVAASDEQLQKMQDELYGAGNGTVKENEKKSSEDKAREIFEKTQSLKQETEKPAEKKKAKTKELGEKFEGSFPEFDTSQFIEGEDEEEPEEDLEEEPGEEEGETEGQDEDSQTVDKEVNIKNLRQIAGNFKKERNEALSRIKDLEAQLENKPDVNGLQSQITELQDRVKQLEPYELVFALHQNPSFKQKFIDGPNQIVTEMKQIATDYDVDEEVVGHILIIDNRKELDEVLEEYFPSVSARTDLKALKQKYGGMMRERAEFEKKPQEALAQFHSKKEQEETLTNQQRDAHIESIMKSGWASALNEAMKVEKQKKIYELIEQPGKKDHNEKVVRPTLANAQSMLNTGMSYIEQLARTKATPSEGFVQWFAQICQQAAATQMVNHVRWGIYEKYQDLLRDQKTQRGYDRPGVSTQKGTAPAKRAKKSGRDISAEIFESVVSS